ncbi:MAG: TlyA family RNA methyltransferase [Actinomycetia bacterium]|nr:TlyA family RNA methyltransferase [Actinomycetes bacterium]
MTRLDVALVARGFARSRGHARDLIDYCAVHLNGTIATKASTSVAPEDSIEVVVGDAAQALEPTWVSRAAGKLLGALEDLPGGGPDIAGVRAADVGACTGGFTQVLLERGADHVLAIDVGHGQLAEQLRTDPRVSDRSGVNARDLTAEAIGGPVDLVVADLSFISLTLVLEPLTEIVRIAGDLVLLIKPQFEVGRRGLDGRGVVRPGPWRRQAVESVVRHAYERGLDLRSLVVSRTPGQDGNTEFVAWFRRPGSSAVGRSWEAVSEMIDAALAAAQDGGGR